MSAKNMPYRKNERRKRALARFKMKPSRTGKQSMEARQAEFDTLSQRVASYR